MRINHQTIFWIGVGLLTVGAIFIAFGSSPDTYYIAGLVDVSLGSDGRCTGFPSGFLKWNWSACCTVHDAGGTDGQLMSCLLDNTPMLAMPVVCLAGCVMGLCRPIYNVGQRWGIWK